MLPVHRIIAHREYGNTPPGGYPGRKQDPTYDMAWRRGRVANFRPRTGTPTEEDPLARLSDDGVAKLEELVEVFIPGRSGRKPGPGWERIDTTKNNTTLLVQQNTALLAAVSKLAEVVASGRDDLTADELRQAVSQGIQEAGAALRAIQDSDEPVSDLLPAADS